MAAKKKPSGASKKKKKTVAKKTATKGGPVQVCELPPIPDRPLPAELGPGRMSLIRMVEKKWVNGTVLHFHFLDSPASWRGPKKQKQAVRDAFQEWKDLGIGLSFVEVDDPADAEVRIAFQRGSSWSYVGRDCIDLVSDAHDRTMNFGWDLTTLYGHDTALHEIGHALGFPHEHQNPKAGMVWDEEAVYTEFAGPPNSWSRDKTFYNIIRKLDLAEVEGSDWDKDSVMHYQFDAGLILVPEMYKTLPLIPKPGLSPLDIDRVQHFYPALEEAPLPKLEPFVSRQVTIGAGEQLDFAIDPPESRNYVIQTFGAFDSVMVLFDETDGSPLYVQGDDDSGTDYNARIESRLVRGRKYVLRLRLYFAHVSGQGALMMW
jgi:hypothetical protein